MCPGGRSSIRPSPSPTPAAISPSMLCTAYHAARPQSGGSAETTAPASTHARSGTSGPASDDAELLSLLWAVPAVVESIRRSPSNEEAQSRLAGPSPSGNTAWHSRGAGRRIVQHRKSPRAAAPDPDATRRPELPDQNALRLRTCCGQEHDEQHGAFVRSFQGRGTCRPLAAVACWRFAMRSSRCRTPAVAFSSPPAARSGSLSLSRGARFSSAGCGCWSTTTFPGRRPRAPATAREFHGPSALVRWPRSAVP